MPRIWVLVLALVIGGCAPAGEDSGLRLRIHESFSDSNVGDAVDLASVLDPESWDRLVAFEGEPPAEFVAEVLGFEWPGYEGSMRDGSLLVFVKDEQVRRWTYFPWVDMNSDGSFVLLAFPPDRSWFEVKPGNTSFVLEGRGPKGPIQVCYQTCPPR